MDISSVGKHFAVTGEAQSPSGGTAGGAGTALCGFDVLPMLRDYPAGNAWFEKPQWEAA